jgi:DNA-binding transcriptional MerR regulator
VPCVSDVTADLTIEELAQRAQMSVRNIRAHQSRGLLPPPEVRGRTGYYGAQHVERLRLIREMQADGFNLQAIAHFVGEGRAGEELIGFKRAVTAPFETEAAEVVDEGELAGIFGPDPELRAKAEKLGIIRPLGDGRVEVPSPRLLRAGGEVVALGLPLEEALRLVEELRKPANAAARRFVRLYTEAVWEPFERAGMPDEGWPEIREGVERLRPLAAEVLLAIFESTMTEAVELAFGREAEKLGRKRGGKRRAG